MIDVRRDFAGLRIAAAELYEEAFVRKEFEHSLRELPLAAESVLGEVESYAPRSISQGFYLWVQYLLWLKSVCALPGCALELLADEAEGLLAVTDAEREFRKAHPSCWKCGELNVRDASYCRSCSADFKND
jgi:hypothetical protein